jgi:hypothetical protein
MRAHWIVPATAMLALGLLATGPAAANDATTAEMAEHCRVLVQQIGAEGADGAPAAGASVPPAVLADMNQCASYLRGIRAGFAAGVFAATSNTGISTPPTEHTTNEQLARFFVRWTETRPERGSVADKPVPSVTVERTPLPSDADDNTLRAEIARLETELASTKQTLADERAQYRANLEAQHELLADLKDARKGSIWQRLFGGRN